MSVDLSTEYLGLQLSNPLVAAAGPLTGNVDKLARLEDAGVSAVVLPSLFEEQIENRADEGNAVFYDTWGFPEHGSQNNSTGIRGVDLYVKLIESSKQSLKIPVIGSLNGKMRGEWIRFAHMIESAGADALELNLLIIPVDARTSTQDVEETYLDLVSAARAAVSIPISVKIGPYFSALPYFTQRLINAGANGVVLFNRFLEPEFDLESLEVEPYLELSHQSELRTPLRWIAVLRDQFEISLAATSGIHDSQDMVRAILAGANVTMVASALMRHGVDHAKQLLEGLEQWLSERHFESIRDARGFLSRKNCSDGSVFERANYMRMVSRFNSK